MNKHLRLASTLASLALLPACSQADSHISNSYTAPIEERPKTAEELRAELLTQEQAAPASYLAASGTYHRNLISQLVLEGYIANAATLADYKDPMLSVTWYSKTGTEVGTKQYPVYEVVRAKAAVPFKLKTDAPDYVARVTMDVSDATAVE